MEENDNDFCCFCLQETIKTGNPLINNTCYCKNKIHIKCLVKMVLRHSSQCKICNGSNGSVIDPCGHRVSFPSKGIYKMALTDSYNIIEPNDKTSKLYYAILYLQTNIIRELLETFTPEEYKKYYENTDYDKIHSRHDFTNALTLKPVILTNYSRQRFPQLFAEMERIFATYHKKLA